MNEFRSLVCRVIIPLALLQIVHAGFMKFDTETGSLGFQFGSYHTIEGTVLESVKSGTRTLSVDTIDGSLLEKPVPIWIENIANPGLPKKTRVILKGYESGEFIGIPHLTKEEHEIWGASQAMFQFQCSFIPTTIVSPKEVTFEHIPSH